MRYLSLFLILCFGLPTTICAQSLHWQKLEAQNAPQKRHENAFALCGDKCYLLGGRGLKPIDIYEPALNEWKQGAQPPLEMHHFQAVSHQGLIYVMGAFTGGWPYESPITHILIYDPLSDQWFIGPRIPTHRQRGAAGAVAHNGKLYLVCGIVNGHTSHWVPWLDEFDPATGRWQELPDAPRARDHFQAAVVNNKLYAAGGRRSGYEGQGFEATIAEVDVYDFATGSWSTLPPSSNIPTQRAGCTAVVMGEEIAIIGGESGSQQAAHAEVELLNTRTHSWRSLPGLLQGRHGTQAFYANGALYIAAGCGMRGGNPELNSVEVLAASTPPTLAQQPLKAGSLQLSTDTLRFSGVQPFRQQQAYLTLTHSGGNQAILITHALLTGDEAFQLKLEEELPLILPPGTSKRLLITLLPRQPGGHAASLLLKQHTRREPLEVKLSGQQGK